MSVYSRIRQLRCKMVFHLCFFFFSSRRRHTRCSRDWSSDVCSSDLDPGVDAVTRLLLADAQTSGGLLIAVPADRRDALLAALQREHAPVAAVIGRAVPGPAGRISVA